MSAAALPSSEKDLRNLRAVAEKLYFRDGCCALMAAFNITNDASRAWSFPPSVHAKAKAKIIELMALFKGSEIRLHPNAKALAEARGDKAFDRFMMKAMEEPLPRRRKKSSVGGSD